MCNFWATLYRLHMRIHTAYRNVHDFIISRGKTYNAQNCTNLVYLYSVFLSRYSENKIDKHAVQRITQNR